MIGVAGKLPVAMSVPADAVAATGAAVAASAATL